MRECLRFPWLLCCIIVASLHEVKAQQPVTVSGMVKSTDGTPLPGASVVEKGFPANAVMTDPNGNFSLRVMRENNVLLISYIGFETSTIKAGTGKLQIALKPSQKALNDVVVIGYQSVKRRNVTAAVSSMSGKDIQDMPQASFDQMLQGRLAGVSVLSSTAEPGQRTNIVIRGTTNVDYGNANGGNTGPLYVIDGVIFDINTIGSSYSGTNPLSLINPNDVESIDVLKDASASAIYGARGGNGVIIVKTKSAKRGRPQVSVSGYIGATTQPALRNVTTGAAERRLKMGLISRLAPYTEIRDGSIPVQLTDSLNPAFNNNVDWQAMMVRDQALVNNQDVAIAGFLGSANYRVSLNHYNEQGLLKGFSIDRLSPNLNLSVSPRKGLQVNTNLMITSEKRNHGTGGGSGQLFASWNFPTSFAQLTPQQIALFNGQANPFDDNNIFAYNGSIGVVDTLVKNVVFHSTYSANNYIDKWAYFSPKELNGISNMAFDITSSNPSWSFENYAEYNTLINKHHINLVAGASAYAVKNYSTWAQAQGISVTGIHTLQTIPPGSSLNVTSSQQKKTTVSYYARLSYDYEGKYMLTASFRRDASSIYSPEYRWGTFPAFSAGWILSDEHFFQPLKNVVNFVKVRASWGITGNDPGSFYAKYQGLYNDGSFLGGSTGIIVPNGTFPIAGGTPSTYNGTPVISPYPYYDGFGSQGISASNSVRWEKYIQPDFGVDISMFNDRIGITADWYRKDAKDKYFYQVPAQTTTGYRFYAGNFADVRNEGIELVINTHNLNPRAAFQWNTNFNISFNKNYVTKLPNNNRDFLFGESWFQQTLTMGEPLYNYKVYQINGAFPTEASVPTDPMTGKKLTYLGRTLHAGDPNYQDMNGDYNIDYDDKVIAGNPLPKVTGGFGNSFSYKGISLNIFCSFLTGRKIFNGYLSDALNGSRSYSWWGTNAGPAVLTNVLNQFWQRPGDVSKYPNLVSSDGSSDRYNIASSYFVEDGSFLRVKQVSLSYNFPARWVQSMRIRSFNVFGMADNLLTFKRSPTIPDPELVDPTTGSSNMAYPAVRKFTIGIRAEL